MTEAERVLAEVATKIHKNYESDDWPAILELSAPYLPKPEPDRLTVAARECVDATYDVNGDKSSAAIATRAIIAREVAAAEPSDEAIEQIVGMVRSGTWTFTRVRAALTREGA